MFFNHPIVRDFLIANREVFTLRAKRRREGRERLVYGALFRNTHIGSGMVTLVSLQNVLLAPRVLCPSRVAKSGFATRAQWLDAFMGINKNQVPTQAYLYHVTLVQ